MQQKTEKMKQQAVLPENYQLNLSDFALFLSVMKVKEAYQGVLSIILDEPDLKLKEVKVEQVILNKSGKRAIRLDAWVQDVPLEDGTSKIFLNMTSKNGRDELVSLLQYMKNTTLDNEEIKVKDKRILELDRIVGEVKQSEEWEAVEMNILETGIEQGIKKGEDSVNRLNTILIEADRLEDLKRASKDYEYQKELMKELLPEKE